MASHKSLYIDGSWHVGKGPAFESKNPASGKKIWHGQSASKDDVERAVASSRCAFRTWGNTPLSQRIDALKAFAALLAAEKQSVSEIISEETGKIRSESNQEVGAMINKVDISLDAYEKRASTVAVELASSNLVTRFRPLGVVAVLGPFNFPGHLPHGHIIPALLAGNTVVFKPSELTPLTCEKLISIWEMAGLPAGALNLLQGGRDPGQWLAQHNDINGLFFTGSWKAGRWLAEIFASHPEKILALEMGGNNPIVVTDVSDLTAAAFLTIQSAYATSGQRCSCARRLIVPKGKSGDRFIERLSMLIAGIRVGAYDSDEDPYMGPVISPEAAAHILERQRWLAQHGGIPIVTMQQLQAGPAFLTPGLIDVTAIKDRPDEEIFGPLLQLIRVKDFNEAIAEANNTAFGLSAGLLSDNHDEYIEFRSKIKAGVVNWNMPLTGASSLAPFGGVGHSGNYRPSGYFAIDYCHYPVASMERPLSVLPAEMPPGIDFKMEAWA